MLSSTDLKKIVAEARPLIEQQLDLAEQIAGLREVVTAHGGDWSQLKALIKAQVQDERDDAGDGKRVRKILDRADYAKGYADMLGLANLNEFSFSDDDEVPPADDSTRSSGDRGSASSVPSDGAAATHSEAAAASAGDEPAAIAASPAPIHPPLETAGLPVAAAAGDVPRNSRGVRYPEGCMEPECCHSSSWRQRCTSCDRAHGEIERANFAAAELDRPLADRLTS